MLLFFLACSDPGVEALQNDIQKLQQKQAMLEQRIQRLEGGNALSTPSEPDTLSPVDGSTPEQPNTAVDGAPAAPKGSEEISVRMESATKEDKKLSSDTQTLLVKLEDPTNFCTTTPHKEGETIKGYLLSDIKDDSAAKALGLEEGDIIVAINTMPIRDAAEWTDGLLHLKKVQFSILLERNGSDLLHNYSY